MSYSNVYFHRKRSIMHYWEFNEKGEKEHKSCPAPLYFYSRDENGDFKTIYGDKVKKIECDTWGEFKQKIENYKNMGISVYETDVPIETKFIVQEYLGKQLELPNFDIHFMDIEVHSEEGFPDPENADYPITIIATWSTKDNKFYIFSEREFDDSFIEEDHQVFIFDSEEELLKSYIKFTATTHPDIISGWNSNGFDIPYIINRTRNLLGENWVKRISPIGVIKDREYHITETKTQTRYEIGGISCLDMLEVYKNYTFSEKENYRLGYIASIEIGATKLEYEGTIVDLYADWQKYVEYNIQDTRLLRQLEDKLGYIKMLINFCYGCRVPFEHFDRTTRVLDGAFISELAKEGVVLPDVNRGLKDVKYPGGFVKDPIRGMHEWIISFDATSLYPSIMMNWNISPETKVGVINQRYLRQIHRGLMGNLEYIKDEKDKKKRVDLDETCYDNLKFKVDKDEIGGQIDGYSVTKVIQLVKEKSMKVINEWGGVHSLMNEKVVKEIQKCLVGEEFEEREFEYDDEEWCVSQMAKYLKDNNYCLACNGVIYRQDFQGVIPRFVENWFNQRKNYKKLMLDAKDKVSKAKNEKEKEEWKGKAQLYDLLQLNFKILINSVYGYLGTVYSRLYDFDNCVAVCINGQNITKTTANTLDNFFERKFNIKDVVIYGDTDSVYLGYNKVFEKIKIPKDTDEPEEINKIIEKYISDDNNPKCIESVTTNVIQKAMESLTQERCNCSDNKIFFKREAVARNGIFLERKRYVAWVLNDEGVSVNKLKVTGVEIVRSSTPIIVQKFLKEIVFDMLKKNNKEYTRKQVSDARDKFMSASPEEIAKPTGIKTYDKYVSRMEGGDNKGVPSQVKAAFIYNNIINKDRNLKQKYEEIFEGDKMKLLYMKKDSVWRNESFGFKDKWVTELEVEHLIDREKQMEVVFVNPLLPFYHIMNWDFPNFNNEEVGDLFDW